MQCVSVCINVFFLQLFDLAKHWFYFFLFFFFIWVIFFVFGFEYCNILIFIRSMLSSLNSILHYIIFKLLFLPSFNKIFFISFCILFLLKQNACYLHFYIITLSSSTIIPYPITHTVNHLLCIVTTPTSTVQVAFPDSDDISLPAVGRG